jgi:hypothetical protein
MRRYLIYDCQHKFLLRDFSIPRIFQSRHLLTMYDQVASGHAWSERILIGNLVLTFSTTASLILRICARLITKTKFGWDDYVLFLGQAFWYGQITIQIFAALAAKKMITFADSKFLDFLYVCSLLM